MATSGVYRGQYGPTPKQAVPSRILWARRLEALWCGWIARHLIRAPTALGALRTEDAQVLARAIRGAKFQARSVTGCPAGYRLESAEVTPYSKDVLTLAFASSAGYRFELVQRPSWIALRDQLETAQVPFTDVSAGGVRLHVVHGRYGGEPIDRSFWATRRAVMWEREGLLLEMREVIGRGPGLATLMALAGRIVAGEGADRPLRE